MPSAPGVLARPYRAIAAELRYHTTKAPPPAPRPYGRPSTTSSNSTGKLLDGSVNRSSVGKTNVRQQAKARFGVSR